MNDPQLALNKLSELGEAALQASNEAEKAAIFAAVHILCTGLEEHLPGYKSENLERARWSICALLGYDTDNGHSQDQHLSWALASIESLKGA
ncbi:hypothetical protein [Synechococcus sp. CBW1107]|uniref:hypothetical protein n=1 Tax=Synechococcus sp. CBW1107 TaxID=2789857 RepID=UPI002AD23138|nr:hypothetical protein [Synechococcus sp. CBW1107]